MRCRIFSKRPCRVCRRWYRPDPRVGDRQRTCGDQACQREWNRRLSKRRREREPYREREDRLRDQLQRGACGQDGSLPEKALALNVARRVIGLGPLVVIDEYGRVLREWVQHGMPVQVTGRKGKVRGLLPGEARHEIPPQVAERKGKVHGLLPGEPRHEIGRRRTPN